MPRGGRREKAGRKSGWVNSETQLIRVPKILANRLIEVAKHLDQGDEVQLVGAEALGEIQESSYSDELSGQLSFFSMNQGVVDHPLPQPLGLRGLARRLGVSSGTLSTHKRYGNEQLLGWTVEKDPEKWGWSYDERTGKFHPTPFAKLVK